MDFTSVVKIIFYYYKNNTKCSVSLFEDAKCTVREIKNDLYKNILILSEYIELRLNGISLDDDKTLDFYEISEVYKINIHIKVSVDRASVEREVLIMKYDHKIKNFIIEYGKITKNKNIFINCDRNYDKNEKLRKYLTKSNYVFNVYGMLKVNVTDKKGKIVTFETNENNNVETVKLKLKEKFNYNYEDLLMIEGKIVEDYTELYKYEREGLVGIYVSFYIFVKISNENGKKIRVNFCTTIKKIKKFLSKRLNIELEKVILIYKEKELENEKSIGFYGINENNVVNIFIKMNVVINFNEEDIITTVLERKQRIVDLKEKIFENFRLSVEKIMLFLNEKELKNEVEFENLKDKTRLYMKIKGKERFSYNNGKFSVIEDYGKHIHVGIINTLKSVEDIREMSISVDSTTVEDLRKRISRECNINLCKIGIYYEKMCLQTGLVKNYDLKNESILYLKPLEDEKQTSEPFIIKIKNQNCDIQRFLMNKSETIGGLKKILRDQNNVNIDRIKLSFEGREVRDEDVVSEISMGSEDVLEVFIKSEQKKEKEVIVGVRNIFNKVEEDEEDGECGKISCQEDHNVEELKSKLDTMFGLSSADYVITFNGDILKLSNKISTYNVKNGDELMMSGSVLVRYYINDDNASAKVFRYPIFPGDKVVDLKLKISKRIKLEIGFIHLTYDGCVLEDGKKLCNVGVKNGSYLMMTSSLAGGSIVRVNI